jgi:hypothetical protein
MNENSKSSGSWSWLWNSLMLLFIIGIIIGISIPNFASNGRNKVSDTIGILRLIDSAKNGWAVEHGITNQVQMSQFSRPLTEADIAPLLTRSGTDDVNLGFNRDGTLHPIAGEIYTINNLGAPPEAKLTCKEKFGKEILPAGTIIRLTINAANGVYEVILPNQQTNN